MRNITLAAMAFVVTTASPASAQSVPDDVRCFLLSNGFAKQATDPKARQVAVASLTFYLGRLDGKADAATIANTVRREGPAIDPKSAGAQMIACASRMAHAEQSIQAAINALAPAPPK